MGALLCKSGATDDPSAVDPGYRLGSVGVGAYLVDQDVFPATMTREQYRCILKQWAGAPSDN